MFKETGKNSSGNSSPIFLKLGSPKPHFYMKLLPGVWLPKVAVYNIRPDFPNVISYSEFIFTDETIFRLAVEHPQELVTIQEFRLVTPSA